MQTVEWPSQILDVREIGDYDYQVPLLDPDPTQFKNLAQSDGGNVSVGFQTGICVEFILDEPPMG